MNRSSRAHVRRALMAAISLVIGTRALSAQARPLTANDSALVGRILLAEDRRDSLSSAIAEGAAHADARIQLVSRRAAARTRDARFAARDSLPAVSAPPVYADAAWRIRYRALSAKSECASLRTALSDSVWHVRLRAADLLTATCASDSVAVRIVKEWADPVRLGASFPTLPGGASWHPAAHAVVALARLAPGDARTLLPAFTKRASPALRAYAARAATELADTAMLRRFAADANDNVKEVAIDGLAKIAGHAADDVVLRALSARGYQAVRAAARALKGSPRGGDVLQASLTAATRLRTDSSETSRDARVALLERISEFAHGADTARVAALATDFDCVVAKSAATIATSLGTNTTAHCTPLAVTLPTDAVALALGANYSLRVMLANGGAFTVRLRGDVAPLMAARILALAKSGWYRNRTWYRVEPDFVIQGGGPGSNEYVGHPRFMRDELGAIPHVRGTVGMSTRGHDTGDAQWFVNLKDNLRLGRDYTVFAEVTEGIEVVDAILEGEVIARIDVVGATARRR